MYCGIANNNYLPLIVSIKYYLHLVSNTYVFVKTGFFKDIIANRNVWNTRMNLHLFKKVLLSLVTIHGNVMFGFRCLSNFISFYY